MGNQRRGGILFLTLNGKSYDVKGSWEITPPGEMREPVEAANATGLFKARPRTACIKGVILDRGGLNIAELAAMEGGQAVLGLGTKKAFSMTGCWANVPSHTTEEGEIQTEIYAEFAEYVDVAA